MDALGRTVVSVVRNRTKQTDGSVGPLERLTTRSRFDIRGNLLELRDALDRPAFRYTYRTAPGSVQVLRGSERARGRGSLVRRRNLRQGQRRLAPRYRAVDQHRQVIDGYLSARRDIAVARRFFGTALADHDEPSEVITDPALALANPLED